jgi:hypothetical protein
MYFHADSILFRGARNLVIQRSNNEKWDCINLYIVFLPRNLELVWPCTDQLEDVSESLNKHFQRYCEFRIVPNPSFTFVNICVAVYRESHTPNFAFNFFLWEENNNLKT